MFPFSRLVVVFAIPLIAATAWVGESDSDPEKPLRLDRTGDPLPTGAIARIGTVRFRHGLQVYCVGFTPDGEQVVSSSQDGTLRVWDRASGKELQRLGNGNSFEAVQSFTISRDGRQLAFGNGNAIVFFDLKKGKELFRKTTASASSCALAFSSDGGLCASSGSSIELWDVNKAMQVREFEYTKQWIESLTFSADDKTLIAGGDDGTIRFYNVATGKEAHRVEAHKGPVISVVLSPDGKLMASTSHDGVLRLADAATAGKSRVLAKRLAESEYQGASRLAFSPNGQWLAWAGERPEIVQLYDVESGKKGQQFKGHASPIESIAFSPDGKTLVTGGSDSTVRLWEVATGKQLPPPHVHQSGAWATLSPNGKAVVTRCVGVPTTIYLWDVDHAKEVRSEERLDEEWVLGLGFSPDGNTLASCNFKGMARLWNGKTGKELCRFQGPKIPICWAQFSSDLRTVATYGGSEGPPLEFWDTATGKRIGEFSIFSRQLALALNGKTAAALQSDGKEVLLWDIPTKTTLHYATGNPESVAALAFSPDGNLLATVGGIRSAFTVRVWDVRVGELLCECKGHTARLGCVCFSHDSKTVISGADDNTVRVWEVASGKQRDLLDAHQGPIISLSIANDGRRLASGSYDTTALVWDLAAHALVGQTLSPDLSLAKLQDDVWADLADKEAAKANRALWNLVLDPEHAVALLKKRLAPAVAVSAKKIDQLILDLDSDKFETRDKARKALETICEQAEPALRQTLKNPPSTEVQGAAEALVAKIKAARTDPLPERLRDLRAIEVLEHINNSEAVALLTHLATGVEACRLTQEAKLSLERLKKSAAPKP
jgi:WD40 repeat protein